MTQNKPHINQYYIEGHNDTFRYVVYWLRLTCSDRENLLNELKQHDFYELQYVRKGGITLSLGQEEHCLLPGEYLLISPKQNHKTVHCLPHTEKWVFGFSVHFRDGYVWKPSHDCSVQKETSTLKKLAELLYDIVDNREPNCLLHLQVRCLTEALIAELFAYEVEFMREDPNVLKKNDRTYREEWFEQVQSFIREQVQCNDITVKQLAERFYVSGRHLSRICLEMTGKTPHQLIDNERIKYLREVLMTSNENLSTIAIRMGFSSENAMTRFFRASEGYTPSQYRKYTTQK